MRCLVTGGAGFIGSQLALELERQGHDVVVADNFRFGHESNLRGLQGMTFRVDVSRPFEVPGRFDAVFHQAAITDPRFENPQETWRENTEGFKIIVELARKQQARLVYASSASMYGNGPAPQQEDQPKDLLNKYAESKLWMDEYAAGLYDEMHIVGLRYFNVFGPGESHKGRPASMIYHLTRQMKAGQRPKIFHDGQQKRDQIYVADCVLANLKALDAPSGVYNVGTGVGTTFNELVAYINEALGTDLQPEYIDNPYEGTYQDHTQADTTRAEEKLGFAAQYTPRQGVLAYAPTIE